MATDLSHEDRLIIRHIRYYPSTQLELQDVFQQNSKEMRSRLVRFKRNNLIFTKLQKMPQTRLPKNLQPGLSHSRLVYFAMPNPHMDHYSKLDVDSLFDRFKKVTDALDIDEHPEKNLYLLGLIDTMLRPLYTRYAYEQSKQREVDE